MVQRRTELKHVLITGGAGFIGTNLIAHLTAKGGYELTALDDESMGSGTRVVELGARFVPGDVRDSALMTRLAREADVIIHLAADTRVMDSIDNPAHNFDVNVVGTFRVLEAARAAGVQCVINASTGGAILGDAQPPVNENMPARPVAPYGAAKLAAEGYCSAFSGAYGLRTVSLRFSNVYGPGSFHKGSVVAHFYKRILAGEDIVIYGDGSQTRDFLYIGDLIEGVQGAMEREATGVFQLGSGVGTTVTELIQLIRNAVGPAYPLSVRHEDFRDGEIKQSWCDVAKARRELNFQPSTALADGLVRTWTWFLDNR